MLKNLLRTKTENDELQDLMQDLSWESGTPSETFRRELETKLLRPPKMKPIMLAVFFKYALVGVTFSIVMLLTVLFIANPSKEANTTESLDGLPIGAITVTPPAPVGSESTAATSPGYLVNKSVFAQYISPIGADCMEVKLGRRLTTYHNGVDITAREGCLIVAMQDGEVTYADWHYITGYTVILKHDDGYQTNYYHGQQNLLVKFGDKVKKGMPIMYMGRSGRTTGIQLHVEIVRDGKYYDPDYYVKLLP